MTFHLHLVTKLRICGAVSIAWCFIKHRDNFTRTIYTESRLNEFSDLRPINLTNMIHMVRILGFTTRKLNFAAMVARIATFNDQR
jgi:hypothetical protein